MILLDDRHIAFRARLPEILVSYYSFSFAFVPIKDYPKSLNDFTFRITPGNLIHESDKLRLNAVLGRKIVKVNNVC